MKTNFYSFYQINSGGSLYTNEKLCHQFYIEAASVEEANHKAQSLGVYFNGVDEGRDCDC